MTLPCPWAANHETGSSCSACAVIPLDAFLLRQELRNEIESIHFLLPPAKRS